VHGALRTIDFAEFGGELGALATQLLRSFRFGPDARVFEVPAYFLESFFLVVVIKEPPLRS
jgi:hypothetical protein